MRRFNDCLSPLLGFALVAGCGGSTHGSAAIGDASVQDSGGAGFPCGSSVCVGAQVCCQAPTVVRACSEKAACQGIAFTCASAADCPTGQVCCGSLQSFAAIDVECKAQCTPGPGVFQPCLLDSECTQGQSCGRSTQAMICVPRFDAGAAAPDAAAD